MRNFPIVALQRSEWTDHFYRCIKLVGKRHCSIDRELLLADHVHELDAGKEGSGGAERFEVEYRPGDRLDGALDLDAGLIHAPAATYQALVFAGHFLNEQQETNRPAVDRRMIDQYAAFFRHLCHVPIVQGEAAYQRKQTRIRSIGKRIPLEVEHVDSSRERAPRST